MPSDPIAAVDATTGHAAAAPLTPAEVAELNDPTLNPLEEQRRDAVARAAEAVQIEIDAAHRADEAAQAGHLDVVA